MAHSAFYTQILILSLLLVINTISFFQCFLHFILDTTIQLVFLVLHPFAHRPMLYNQGHRVFLVALAAPRRTTRAFSFNMALIAVEVNRFLAQLAINLLRE